MTDADEAWYTNHVNAIRLYQQQTSLAEILRRTGVGKDELYRQIDRCRRVDDKSGEVVGFRALKRHKHAGPRNENANKLSGGRAVSGALTALFGKWPDIETRLQQFAVYGKRQHRGVKTKEVNPPFAAIHKEFIDLCVEHGIEAPIYPFCADDGSEGKPALRDWVKRVRADHSRRSSKPDEPPSFPGGASPTRLYRAVQFDGHKIDVRATIEIPSTTEEAPIKKEITRLWVLLIIEVVSKAILGYSIAYGQNYDQIDVLRALRKSLVPWVPRKPAIPGLKYAEGAGFPSALPGLGYVCWEELWLDNFSSHFGDMMLGFCERTIGCCEVFGPVDNKDDRAFAETFFRILEESGVHRLPGTTGSSAKDERGKGADSSLRYFLRDSDVHDIVDVLLANINAGEAPSSSVSRLGIIQRIVDRGIVLMRRIPQADRDRLTRRDVVFIKPISQKKGEVVIRFANEPYTNNDLRSKVHLVGRNATVHVTSDDLRDSDAYLDDGTSLGQIFPPKRWRETKHGFVTRREAKKLESKGVIRHAGDMALAVRTELERRAAKSKIDATKLAKIRTEQEEAGEVSTPPAPSLELGRTNLARPDDTALAVTRDLLRNEHEI